MRPDLDHHGGLLLSREQWLTKGFHARDLAGSDFTSVFHGYLTPTDHPATLTSMARVAQREVLPGSTVSHATAAMLLGIELPVLFEGGVGLLRRGVGSTAGQRGPAPSPGAVVDVQALPEGASLRDGVMLPTIHVRSLGARGATRLKGITVHRGARGPELTDDGMFRISAPVEVLRELSRELPLFDLVAAVEGIIGRRGPVRGVGLPEIVAHLGATRGLRGTAALRRAVDLAREDVRSPGETVMRLLIEDAGLPSPDPNLPVVDPSTGRRRFLDLAWEGAGFALEYDGDGHRVAKDQWRRDEIRRDELAAVGWTLARANGDDLRNPRRIILRVAHALRAKGLVVPTDEELHRYLRTLPSRQLSLRIRGGRR